MNHSAPDEAELSNKRGPPSRSRLQLLPPQLWVEILVVAILLGSIAWLLTETVDQKSRISRIEGQLESIVRPVETLRQEVTALQSRVVKPTVFITGWPEDGAGPDSSGEIKGRVSGLSNQSQYRVVVYSFTDKWYVQPETDNALTRIDSEGFWRREVHLGTKYAALLVQADYDAPHVTDALPDGDQAVLNSAMVEVGRNSG